MEAGEWVFFVVFGAVSGEVFGGLVFDPLIAFEEFSGDGAGEAEFVGAVNGEGSITPLAVGFGTIDFVEVFSEV